MKADRLSYSCPWLPFLKREDMEIYPKEGRSHVAHKGRDSGANHY